MKRNKRVPQSRIPRNLNPYLRFFLMAAGLIGGCLLTYVHTVSFGYTELDDTIFIRELEQYTRSDSYLQSFRRGVFSDTADTYYRPLLLNSFVWDRHREGSVSSILHREGNANDNITQYHWTNIALHIVSVLLVLTLLSQLLEDSVVAFVLTAIFAIHPALAQAIAWIPGRNDTLLAVFTFGFLSCSLEYARNKNIVFLIAQPLLLLGALFTKETGIIAAFIAFASLVLVKKVPLSEKSLWKMAGGWVLALCVWVAIRSSATVKNVDLTPLTLATTFVDRLPLAVQYFGKIILPLNLSVFPWQEDTTIWFGVAAIMLVVVGIGLSKDRDWRMIILGIAWFVAFLIPVLIVPKSINREAFEHRLYLPVIGVLLLVVQTAVFKRLKTMQLLVGGIVLCTFLAIFTYGRTSLFKDKYSFWENAVATTPSSAYAKMMLGSRYYRDPITPRKEEGFKLLQQAYQLDSTQKYLNYYLGSVMMDRGEWEKMESYLRNESAPDLPVRIEIYSNRARGFLERKMPAEAEQYLLKWRESAPLDEPVNLNLLLFYLNDLPRPEKAQEQARYMEANGLRIPPQLSSALGREPSANPRAR